MEYTSPSSALDAIGFGRFQWLLLGYTGCAWFADACEVMLLSFLGASVRCEWGVPASSESTLTSVVFAGMLLGVYTLGALADGIGRRRGFLASAALLGASGLASALAPSFAWLLAIRMVVGMALGGTPIAVTIFAEYLPSAERGRWMLLMQSFWTLGTVFEACLAWAVLPTLGWRWLLALSASPLLLLLAAYPWLPESPHWLLVQGRHREAEAAVLRVAVVNRYGRQMHLNFGGRAVDNPPGKLLPAEHQQPQQRSEDVEPSQLAGGDEGAHLPWVQLPEEAGWDRGAAGSGSREQAAGGGSDMLPGGASARSGSRPAAEWLPGRPPGGGGLLQPFARKSRRRAPGGDEAGGSSSEVVQLEPQDSVRLPLDWRGGGAALMQQLGARLRQLAATMRAAFSQLFGPRLLRTTLLLYAIWFVNAMTYYGLVLLTTALQTSGKAEPCTPQGRPNLVASDFMAILITSIAEAPGLLGAALLVDWCGRKWTLRAMLLCCSSAAILLAATPAPSRGWQLFLLFVARGAIEGSYCALYIYTPELYPTAVRSFGLALCNAFSRIGGFLAPFATVYLVDQHNSQASEALLGTLCMGAVGAAFFLPFETRGADLHEHDVDAVHAVHDEGIQGGDAGEGAKLIPVLRQGRPGPPELGPGEAGRGGESAPLLPQHP